MKQNNIYMEQIIDNHIKKKEGTYIDYVTRLEFWRNAESVDEFVADLQAYLDNSGDDEENEPVNKLIGSL